MNKLLMEFEKYKKNNTPLLPVYEKIKTLKEKGASVQEIKDEIGASAFVVDYVPDTLYHGSENSYDVLKSNESTQGGRVVYATDNPIHALFFSIFRNSSELRGRIREENANGEYKVKYYIDERAKGAIDRIITDKNITIYVLDGKDFHKPQGNAFIAREWVSEEGKAIVPLDKIQVNVKDFFEQLKKDGLVVFDEYRKSKDWETIIDMVSQNYAFGLTTEKGKTGELDSLYDAFIMEHFQEKLEFSRIFREYAKGVMSDSSKTVDEKIRKIRETGRSLLNNGTPNIEKIKVFLEQNNVVDIEKVIK